MLHRAFPRIVQVNLGLVASVAVKCDLLNLTIITVKFSDVQVVRNFTVHVFIDFYLLTKAA